MARKLAHRWKMVADHSWVSLSRQGQAGKMEMTNEEGRMTKE
jgi:hypothetical protein